MSVNSHGVEDPLLPNVELLICLLLLLVLTAHAAAEPLRLPHNAVGGGRCMGGVEHHSWRLRLLPHERHGGEDPHSGERPLHPPVCHCRPLCWSDPSHDIHTMEKTLMGSSV